MVASQNPEETPPPGNARTAWRKIRANASIILGERAVFALVNLAAAALAVRTIGLEGFGVVTIVHAYARLIGDTLRFQSWQAVLRYGGPLIQSGDHDGFRRLIGLTLRLDVLALAGSLFLAVFGAGFMADLFNWSPEVAALAPWYALSIIFMISATPTGLLRLFNRFGVLATQHAMTATIRLIGALALWLAGGSVGAMVAVWFAATVISGTYMMTVTFMEVKKRRLLPRIRPSWTFRRLADGFEGIWGFVFGTNLVSTLSAGLPHLATLVVGAALGTSSASLYAIARQVANGVSKPAKLMAPVIFPEIVWLRASGKHVSVGKLLRRAFIAGTVGVALIAILVGLAGPYLLEFIFGPEALDAYGVMVLAAAASALMVWGFALEPTLLSAGRIGTVLIIQVIGATVFLTVLLTGLPVYGLIAAGFAHFAQSVIVFSGRLLTVRRVLAKDEMSSRAASDM